MSPTTSRIRWVIQTLPEIKKPITMIGHHVPKIRHGSYPYLRGKVTFSHPSVNTRLVVIFFQDHDFLCLLRQKGLDCGLIKPQAYREKFSSWLSINQTNP
jgi:hypothetical protein